MREQLHLHCFKYFNETVIKLDSSNHSAKCHPGCHLALQKYKILIKRSVSIAGAVMSRKMCKERFSPK